MRFLGDVGRALGQFGDPAFRRVLALGVGLTVALLLAFYVGAFYLVGWLMPAQINLPWIGPVSWIDDLASGASVLALLVLSVFLMVPVAATFTSLFLDEVTDAVEARHYPHLTPARQLSLVEALGDSLSYLGVMILGNIMAFAAYIALPPFAPLIFLALNGFLLGREYATLIAARRLGREGARAFRRKHAVRIWAAGCVMAAPLVIPVVNLLVPVLGAASFTHLYHRLARTR